MTFHSSSLLGSRISREARLVFQLQEAPRPPEAPSQKPQEQRGPSEVIAEVEQVHEVAKRVREETNEGAKGLRGYFEHQSQQAAHTVEKGIDDDPQARDYVLAQLEVNRQKA